MTPKELYRLVEGNQVWTVTSADADEVYNGETYISTACGRTEIEDKNQLSRANLDVSFPLDNEMARRWNRQIMEAVVSLTLFVKNSDGVYMTAWKGQLASVKPETSAITLVFESMFTSLRRSGLRRRCQRTCGHILYLDGCNLNKDDFAVKGTVKGIAPQKIIVPEAAGYPDGYFTGGMVEGSDGALRFVINHIGEEITLIRTLESIVDHFKYNGWGMNWGNNWGGFTTCRLFPGCPRERQTCHDRFDNHLNFGGFPFMGGRNPFDGTSII